MTEAAETGSGLILLHPDDNVLIAVRTLTAGSMVEIDGASLALTVEIELGHKVARIPLAAGDKVYRYGAPIGTIARAIERGEHVHSHNLDSDYIAPTDRDGGSQT